MDAGSELTQLPDPHLHVFERLLHQHTRPAGVLRQPPLGQLQAHHGAHQLLLGTVVQIAAEATALFIACVNDPGARGSQLLSRVHVGERGRD
jgi:hypothetical protein